MRFAQQSNLVVEDGAHVCPFEGANFSTQKGGTGNLYVVLIFVRRHVLQQPNHVLHVLPSVT